MAKSRKAQDSTTASTGPQALGPLVVVPAGVAAASKLYDVWKARQAEFAASEPLEFAVLTSVSQDTKHTVTILCENRGIHGVYLDKFLMTDPKGMNAGTKAVPMSETILESESMSYQGPAGSTRFLPLPVLLPPGKKACVEVEFDRFTPERLKKGKTFGTLEVHYVVLGVAKADLNVAVEFSVRPLEDK